MNPCPKPKTKKSAPFDKFIRSEGCEICGQPARGAHQNLGYGYTAGKASSIQQLGLCDDHHNMGRKSEHNGQVTFWASHFGVYQDDFPTWGLYREHVDGLKAKLIIKNINKYLGQGGRL